MTALLIHWRTSLPRYRHVTERRRLCCTEKSPSTAAASLHNIELALASLRIKRGMPPEFLWSGRALYEGETAVIVPLLAQIRRVLTPCAIC